MRSVVALIVSSFILGSVLGAFHVHAGVFIIVLCGCALFTYRIGLRIQHIVAVALLLLCGYAQASYAVFSTHKTCTFTAGSPVVLGRIYALSPKESRYVFNQNDDCSILVYAPRFPVLVRGTRGILSGKHETPQQAFSKLPEYAEFLLDGGIDYVVRTGNVEVIEKGSDPLDSFRVRVMSRIEHLFSEPDASLLVAMLTGDQGMIPAHIKDIYRKSGITHILSISGLHVSIIALVLGFCIRRIPLPGYMRVFVLAVFLWAYIIGVGAPASAVRAGVFWTLFSIGYQARALIGMLTVILITLAIILGVDPMLTRSIGFELSVTAVCGIGIALFFFRRVRLAPVWRVLGSALAVSVGATITTAPLTMYYFGTLSIVGLITNLLVVPLLPAITYLSIAALFVSEAFSGLGIAIAFLVHILMSWILFVATALASIPYGHAEEVRISLRAVLLYYACLVAGIIGLMRYFKISWRQWWI